MADTKKKIAVLGGGAGALTTVYQLTNEPGWQDKYDITIYQLGWRLGGKGASGRGINGRIEEHGLHIWMGWYLNAFRIMKNLYDAMKRPAGAPLQKIGDAFKAFNDIYFGEQIDNKWTVWPSPYGFTADEYPWPADNAASFDESVFPTPGSMIKRAVELLVRHVTENNLGQKVTLESAWKKFLFILEDLWHGIKSAVITGVIAVISSIFIRRPKPGVVQRHFPIINGIISFVEWLARVKVANALIRPMPKLTQTLSNQASGLKAETTTERPHKLSLTADLLRPVLTELHKERLATATADDVSKRRLAMMMELMAITIIGMIDDGIIFKEHGFDEIDGEDYRAWLARHGADHDLCYCSVVKGMYDLLLAYVDGKADPEHASLAAGVSARFTLRMVITYRGAIFWKMQAGMGDTIFTPMHIVLQQKGVKFEYFHRVENLGLSADKKSIQNIRMTRQATIKNNAVYNPFVNIQGLDCWPSYPNYDQLEEGFVLAGEPDASGKPTKEVINLESKWAPWPPKDQAEKYNVTLECGKDFDIVVFGISIGSVPYVASELVAANDAWKQMVDKVKTVRTQALQIWTTPTLNEMGWEYTSPVLDAYIDPLNTWADMTHLLPREDWKNTSVNMLAYFCGVMEGGIPQGDDPSIPTIEENKSKEIGRNYLKNDVNMLFPAKTGAQFPGGFDWSTLVDEKNGVGEARYDSQFWRANIDPSEQYVLSVPGSTPYRLHAADCGFTNLFPTGDWIYTNINAGCVEGTITSGMVCANAIMGRPEGDGIIGFTF